MENWPVQGLTLVPGRLTVEGLKLVDGMRSTRMFSSHGPLAGHKLTMLLRGTEKKALGEERKS